MEKKKKTLLILGLCIFTLTLVGLSYAFWVITLQQTSENDIATACLDVEILNEGKGIVLDPGYPLLDSEGEELTPYTFQIHNKCHDNLEYQVNLEVLDKSTLDSKYIKVKLNEVEKKGKISKLIDNENVNPTITNPIMKEAHKLETGYLMDDESKSYEFRLWMDEDTEAIEESMNKLFDSKITITATYTSEIPKMQEEIFPNTVITDLTDIDSGLIEQPHEDYEGEEGFKTTELRYVGANPNNYVWFNCTEETTSGDENCEKWRIIGLVNVKTTNGITQRIKLIRDESIGEYSWDTSSSNINDGDGINEWSQADLMKLLNPGYENNKLENADGTFEDLKNVNNSLYWNRESGTCYNGQANTKTTCNFNETGMKKENERYIADDIIWNIGTNGNSDCTTSENGLHKHFYEYERSSNNGKVCSAEGSLWHECNDEVERKTTWQNEENKKALVGLMYPSDYGYAVGGGKENREQCLLSPLWSLGGGFYTRGNCAENNWFDEVSDRWTITPIGEFENTNSASFVAYVNWEGSLYNQSAAISGIIYPVVYLAENIHVTDGENNADGSLEKPFSLEIE